MTSTNPLDQVDETDLTSLLHSLKHLSTRSDSSVTPIKHFGIKPLDAIVSIFHRHSKHLAYNPARPPVVEIISASSGDGKTHLCYYAIAAAVLPRNYGGKQAAVVVLDADGKFDIGRLVDIMGCYAASKSTSEKATSHVEMEEEASLALRHIHIFRPQSLASLVATVETLPDYLFGFENHYSAERSVGLLVIDSASAFFWQERNNLEHEQDSPRADSDGAAPSPRKSYTALVSALRHLQTLLDCPILATAWGIIPAKPPSTSLGPPRPSFRPALPPVWQNFCTCRIVVGRESVRKFVSGMTIAQAERDRETRMEVVRKGRFWGAVERWELGEGVRRGFREEGVAREFGWAINEEGVSMNDY